MSTFRDALLAEIEAQKARIKEMDYHGGLWNGGIMADIRAERLGLLERLLEFEPEGKAMSTFGVACKHGSLARACEICERDEEIKRLTARLEAAEKLYNELLYQVSQVHPNESRHETALRYIRQAEYATDNVQAKSEVQP